MTQPLAIGWQMVAMKNCLERWQSGHQPVPYNVMISGVKRGSAMMKKSSLWLERAYSLFKNRLYAEEEKRKTVCYSAAYTSAMTTPKIM